MTKNQMNKKCRECSDDININGYCTKIEDNKYEVKVKKCPLLNTDSVVIDAVNFDHEDKISTINQLLDKIKGEIYDHTYLGTAQLMMAIEIIIDRAEITEDIEKAKKIRKLLHHEEVDEFEY